MATRPTDPVANQISGPQHYLPPTARELRAQSVQRLQAGLFGLATMLLLIGLANIIMDRAKLAETAQKPVTAASASAAANAPLSDIGVVPKVDPSASAVPSARPVAN
jgi:hypothetical protein